MIRIASRGNGRRLAFPFFMCTERGAVAVAFSIALIPLVLAAAASVDFARAMIVRANMTDALDTAALSVGSSPNLTVDQLKTQAQKFFDANYREGSSFGTVEPLTIDLTEQKVTISTKCNVPTLFLKFAGIDTLAVGATSTVVWGEIKLWVALVLDNTGSMSSSGKMTALKTASENLLVTLKNAASHEGDVRVAVVPFSKDVNVGTGNVSASWLRWSEWEASTGTCVCTGWGCGWYPPATASACTAVGGTWTPSSHTAWNGCVMDRDKDYDVKNTTPVSSATYFPAEQYSYCPEPLMALTYDWDALAGEIDGMQPNGSTNQTIGLVWGWQALTQGAPLSPPQLPDHTSRVLILLSDGLNTQNRWDGNGYSTSSAVDARMQLACANAKADGIVIYTVLVMAGNSSVLKNCATDSNKYFELTSAGQIITTFNTIAQEITNLRVSQ